jgi:hypothetical protein
MKESMVNILAVLFLITYSYSFIPCVMVKFQCPGILGLFIKNNSLINSNIIGNKNELDTIYKKIILTYKRQIRLDKMEKTRKIDDDGRTICDDINETE